MRHIQALVESPTMPAHATSIRILHTNQFALLAGTDTDETLVPPLDDFTSPESEGEGLTSVLHGNPQD